VSLYSDLLAYKGSKLQRRELRAEIRNGLGTSSDAVPTAYGALRAAERLSRLLELATGGKLFLRVHNARELSPRNFTEAREWLRDELRTHGVDVP
jgi:hypothetical protein